MTIQSKVLIIILIAAACSAKAPQSCSATTDDKKSALVEYVRKEYKLTQGAGLKLTKDEPFGDTCYRALTFEGRSPVKSWQLTMYLSPDGRFLTNELLDTTLDPVEEERRKAEALMAGLAPNTGASKGPENAPVTIVEFSDFECPFCRRFADLMEQVWPTEKDHVRIVFHHFPLSMHPWARLAAEGAACAQLQNSEAFWTLHDQLFRHQQEIDASNVKQKLIEYAQDAKSLDMNSFRTCLDNEVSIGLVFRDMNLASSNNIQGTPTLFINEHRVPGVKDAGQLRQLISEAAKESEEAGKSSAGLKVRGQ